MLYLPLNLGLNASVPDKLGVTFFNTTVNLNPWGIYANNAAFAHASYSTNARANYVTDAAARMPGPGDHLFLVDGSGYIFRAYHALPPLTRKSDGLPIGAVSGFCNMLWRLLREADKTDVGVKPTHFAVIFDASSETFRNQIYDQYKAHRPEPPEDLRPQFGLCRRAVEAFNVASVEQLGYEQLEI